MSSIRELIVHLSKNEFSQEVMQEQALLDLSDSVVGALDTRKMSRSPVHTVAFLILLAGLPKAQRVAAIRQLLGEEGAVDKEAKFEELMKHDIWNSLRNIKDYPGFDLEIETPDDFPEELTTNGFSVLSEILKDEALGILKEGDSIVVTTTVKSEVNWLTEFEKDPDGRWEVSHAGCVSSDGVDMGQKKFLESIIGVPGVSITSNLGGLEPITSGEQLIDDSFELKIKIKPPVQNKFSVEQEKVEIQIGIYGVLVGKDIGGKQIDGVLVKIKGDASFDEKGARAEQKQEVSFWRSMSFTPPVPPVYTVNIDNAILSMYFAEIGLDATFRPEAAADGGGAAADGGGAAADGGAAAPERSIVGFKIPTKGGFCNTLFIGSRSPQEVVSQFLTKNQGALGSAAGGCKEGAAEEYSSHL